MNCRFLRVLAGSLLLAALAGCTTPAPKTTVGQVPARFEGRVERSFALSYLLFRPVGYDPRAERKWPLIVFLHGAGERGNDLEKVAVHGPPKLVKSRPDFPFVVVSPQCPADGTWDVEDLDALLTHILKTEAVDPARVCLTGLSMGGYGTWSWIATHPERFAAAVPICGGGDPVKVWLAGGTRRTEMARLPIWAFHGAKDNVVPLAASEQMVDAYRRIGNQPKLTVYPDAGHDSWSAAYGDPALLEWLLQQHRP